VISKQYLINNNNDDENDDDELLLSKIIMDLTRPPSPHFGYNYYHKVNLDPATPTSLT